jgi:anti-sigma factor RsiW
MMDTWTERLSEYIDGELPAEQVGALEAHLQTCVQCQLVLHDLSAVVSRAAQLPDASPANDLWSGIAQQISKPVVDVVPEQRRRRIAFSIPQLIAASVALIALSGMTMYLVVNREQTEQVAVSTPASVAPVSSEVSATHPVAIRSPAAQDYSAAVSDLETALRTERTRLDTATVRVLENNMRIIDNAIAEARNALSRDPSNPYLNRYLDQTMQRKIQLLQRATNVVRAST